MSRYAWPKKIDAIRLVLVWALTPAAVFAAPRAAAPSTARPAAVLPSHERSGQLALSVGRGDIVRLKSGGIVRGTIDERIPGEYVI
ncbi:MAG TPA: hypothetical protein VIV60_19465, partial [Polyangiaceae bacterium]